MSVLVFEAYPFKKIVILKFGENNSALSFEYGVSDKKNRIDMSKF